MTADTETIREARPIVNWLAVVHAERLAEVSEDRPLAECVAALGQLARKLDAALGRVEEQEWVLTDALREMLDVLLEDAGVDADWRRTDAEKITASTAIARAALAASMAGEELRAA